VAWQYLFVGSRTIRMEFGARMRAKARLGIRERFLVLFSRSERDRYSAEACRVVTEMLQEYGAEGWELVAVVPYTVSPTSAASLRPSGSTTISGRFGHLVGTTPWRLRAGA
jgi:hypothetical protein